jgi:hypothetical protein
LPVHQVLTLPESGSIGSPSTAGEPTDDLDDDEESDERLLREYHQQRVLITGQTERGANTKTVEEYKAIWGQELCFAILREDYQTAPLMSCDICPFNPLPAKPSTLIEYMRWKYYRRGEPVCEFGTPNPIVYQFSPGIEDYEMLVATGDWNSPQVVNKFRASMKLVHKIYDHLRVLYVPKCTDCWNANQNHDFETHGYRSCLTHMGRPRLIEVGCVTESQPFKDEMFLSKKS